MKTLKGIAMGLFTLLLSLCLFGCIDPAKPTCRWSDPKLLDGKGDHPFGQYLKIQHNADSFYRLCEKRVKVVGYNSGIKESDDWGYYTGCVSPYIYWVELYCPATKNKIQFQYNKHIPVSEPFKVIGE